MLRENIKSSSQHNHSTTDVEFLKYELELVKVCILITIGQNVDALPFRLDSISEQIKLLEQSN